MKIRAAASGEGRNAGNTFIAVDDLENRLGSCNVQPSSVGVMIPERPYELKISAEGDQSVRLQLLGTALTRAMVLARESGQDARIHAECKPDDQQALDLYHSIGLTDDDRLVRMTRKAVAGPSVFRLPEGCALVSDDLSDARERAFFLDRQRQLFGREDAAGWLQHLDRMPLLTRLLLVSREGLAGELVCWAEGGRGVIGMVYTAPAWRRKGVAGFLMESARQYFYQNRVREISVDVRLCMTPVVRLAATAGYRQSEVLMHYPGMNMDAPKGTR